MTGRFVLGVDVGSTAVSAALARMAETDRPALETVALAERSEAMPAVVFADFDGRLLSGEVARRRGIDRPERLARMDLAAVGDDIALPIAGRPLPAADVFARLVADAVAATTEQRGSAPDGVVVTHPADWAGYRVDAVRSALARVGLPDVTLLAEPLAAAREHDADSPLRVGQALAVVDLGGTAMRCAVVRKRAEGRFDLLVPSLEHAEVGGVDFDDLVLQHVRGGLPDPVDPDEPAPDTAAWAHLRGECVDAKEELSLDAQATIPVRLPGHDTSVRLTRTEFEQLVEPLLGRTAEALRASLEAAGPTVEAVTMVGGSSRIPRAMQVLSEALDRHVSPGAHPTSAIARGAALAGLAALADDTTDAFAATEAPAAPGHAARPGWQRWAAVLSVSAALLVVVVLLANSLVGLPSVGESHTPVTVAQRAPAASPVGLVTPFDDLLAALPRESAPLPEAEATERPAAAPRAATPTPTPTPAPEATPSPTRPPATPSPTRPPATQPPPSPAPQPTPPPATTAPPTTAPPPATTPPTTAPPPATTPPTTAPPPATTPPTTAPPPATTPPTTAPPPASPDPVPTQDPTQPTPGEPTPGSVV
ncbi:Hsp70 family protein [Propioniciclava sinopodophylli]|uniref:Hsp70 family protein n=1 Tax=Propioniciclava sinopodophylli TaxID=1837344 RepID=UPI00249029F3|nr:Hsp70 family protein [Propioniciclava sinopodophylli]